jgi:solute carrier family 45 protein 1/2/4
MTSPLAGHPEREHPADNKDQAPPSNVAGKGKDQATDAPTNEPNGHGQQQHGDPLSEQSPLLSPSSSEDDGLMGNEPAAETSDEHQASKSVWYLIILTISIGGLQIAWSVEMSNGSPYLLSLGLSKSLMALVWIAGPLSGTLVQPYVGMLSDKCRISWGKRKPFMLGGATATIVSLMFLAWTKEIVGGFLGLFGADPESNFVKVSIIVVAVIWVYVLDFAINTGGFSASIAAMFKLAPVLTSCSSASGNSSLHCGLRAHSRARLVTPGETRTCTLGLTRDFRKGKCHGKPIRWSREHCGVSSWLPRSSQGRMVFR